MVSVDSSLEEKVEFGKKLLREQAAVHGNRMAVACSFGKDSMATVVLAREAVPNIKVFSVMTQYKFPETFAYAKEMDERLGLKAKVYLVADRVPEQLKGMNVHMLSVKEYEQFSRECAPSPLYKANPDKCCDLLKVKPTAEAVKGLTAWVTGLRNTEGRVREDYTYIQKLDKNLVKINPILTFTEKDVYQFLKSKKIPLHPLYAKQFPDGRRYRSLGCAPCTQPVFAHETERAGRWQNTNKCGGECGIHTRPLKHGKP